MGESDSDRNVFSEKPLSPVTAKNEVPLIIDIVDPEKSINDPGSTASRIEKLVGNLKETSGHTKEDVLQDYF